jgi:hypothetical protein
MKKWIVLAMALIFALGLTSVVVAADEKLPVDTKATPKKVTLPPGASQEEKTQMDEAKKKGATKEGAVKETPMPGQGPEEKFQKQEAGKKSTVKKKKAAKPGVPASDVGGLDKMQMEEAKKPSRQDMKKKKEAAPAATEAPAAPAEKK